MLTENLFNGDFYNTFPQDNIVNMSGSKQDRETLLDDGLTRFPAKGHIVLWSLLKVNSFAVLWIYTYIYMF